MNQPQTPDNEVERLREELQDIKDGMKFIMDEKCAESEVHCGCVPLLKISFKEAEQEVARLRELLNRAIEIAEIVGWTRQTTYLAEMKQELHKMKEEARLAPAPEEQAAQIGKEKWWGQDDWTGVATATAPEEPVTGLIRFRTRRPLPVQEEMPNEDEPIEPILNEEIALIEKWGCSKDPIRSVHAQEAFVHVIHAIRCLDNEIQQHEDMFTTWIKATEDQRRELRYLRDEVQKLKEAR